MDEIRLTHPGEADRARVMDYLGEFNAHHERTYGSCGLSDAKNFDEWLAKVRALENPETVLKGFVPSSSYIAERASDGRMVGMIQLRHNLAVDELRRFGGHIGYSVRFSERKKGYATRMVGLVMAEARALKIPYVLITCAEGNAASAATIKRCGGVYEGSQAKADGEVMRRYFIRCAAPAPVLETPRLALRRMTEADLPDLKEILQDPKAMYAYEGPFTDEESEAWLHRQLIRYRDEQVGLWAVTLKESGEMIGQCGLTYQNVEIGRLLEVGYLFKRRFWGHGYATEAARGCMGYAFEVMKAPKVFSIIRESNRASRAVAERNGMALDQSFVKHYRDVDMPHVVYVKENETVNTGYEATSSGGR